MAQRSMAQKRDYYEVLGVDRKADEDTIKKAYRVLFRSGLTVDKATEQASAQFAGVDAVMNLVNFMRASKRGVCR